jgi:RES domain-containing protein
VIDQLELANRLREIAHGPWRGRVYRHMLAGYPPDRENTSGARWNPAGVGAIYTSLERATSMAEAEYHLSLLPVRPRVRRTMYVIRVALGDAARLALEDLARLGLTPETLGSFDMEPCQAIGAAIATLGRDGMIVPSARTRGTNLVIYPANRSPAFEFVTVDEEVIAPHEAP